MIEANKVHEGMLLRIEGKIYKVQETTRKGAAKAETRYHMKLKSLKGGEPKEITLYPEEKLEDISLERYKMQYLYRDEAMFYFMDEETYEQFPIPKEIVGEVALYLKENDEVDVEFYDKEPINIMFPEIVELRVTSAPPGIHDLETTYKKVTLENGMEIDCPQFIKEGDLVRVEVKKGKYFERIKE